MNREGFNKLDINPTNMNLYMEAVTHSSFTNENPNYPDYERLEFLGDAVLEIIISEYLYKERHLEEGTMTRMRASYVCEEACATYAKEIGLDLDIRVGIGEEINFINRHINDFKNSMTHKTVFIGD